MNSYPNDWKAIAKQVKDDANWHCIRCGHKHCRATWHVLTVHHLDGDKANCRWWNLVALCQRCHLHIQNKVQMDRIWMFEHTEWFKPYVAGYYAHHYGLSERRDLVEPIADVLIALGQGQLSLSEASEKQQALTLTMEGA